MDYLKRQLESTLLESFLPNKVLVLLGPRRVGKTVLLHQLLASIHVPYLLLNGEDIATRELLSRRSAANFRQMLDNKLLLVIDEAQKIPEIGEALKLMVDEIAGLRIIITGSSAFDMENYTGEPLTGRKFTFKLFAISEQEYDQLETPLEKKDKLRERLVYGNYPELLQFPTKNLKNRYLNDLVNSYLLKDILTFESLRNSDKILALLRLLAFQVGSEVSNNELGRQLGMSSNTVSKYLDLLSKVFIIYRVGGFSRNLRKEVVKNSKWYFLDNGIRNILAANMNPIDLRNDQGLLWKNYIISERIKFQSYQEMLVNNYFWRTYDQQEIDWVEEREGRLYGYEFKWSPKKQAKAPLAWQSNYPEASFECIHPDNYLDWIRS